jgi:putative MATE family efflux protein
VNSDSDSDTDAHSRDSTTDRFDSELSDIGDPEIEAPMPASALTSFAARGTSDPGIPSHRPSRTIRPMARDSVREILGLAWPVMGSQILLSLSSLVDRMMIGRLADAGTSAVPLAAVGYASQLFFLIHSTLIAVGLACVALMARAIGSGDSLRARHAFAASIQVAALVTLLYSGLIFLFGEPILRALGAEPAVIRIAVPYLQLTLLAALMLSVSLVVESAFRANRDPRTPMFIAVAVTVIKLGLNAVLIFGLAGAPRLELLGAGLATVLSQAVGLFCFVVIVARTLRTSPTGLRFGDLFRVNPVAREVLRISAPSIAERIVLNLGLLSYFWILSRWYGTVAVAAYTVGVAILSFSWIPGTGYAQACATVVGQALGAGDSDAAARAGRRAVWLAIGTAIPLGFLCAGLRTPLARLFTEDASVIATLAPFMLTLAVAQPFLQLHFTLGGVHRGAGDTVTPLVAAMLGNWFFRIPIAALIAGYFELDLVWVWTALIFDHVARSIFLGASFLSGRWKKVRIGEDLARTPA